MITWKEITNNWSFPKWEKDGAAEYLQDIVRNKIVLEIGSYKGQSSLIIADVCAALTCVDPWNGSSDSSDEKIFNEFNNNIQGRNNINYIRGKLADIANDLPNNHFDVVFIDGNHQYDSVKSDATIAQDKVKPDGVFVFHDYGTTYEGVTRFINENYKNKIIGPQTLVVVNHTTI